MFLIFKFPDHEGLRLSVSVSICLYLSARSSQLMDIWRNVLCDDSIN
jgi:hypothetical protein